MSIAVEHGKAIAESNKQRLVELATEIESAGVLAQLNELLEIIHKPEASFTARLAKKRAERNSFTGYE